MLSQADGPFINLARSLSLQYLQNPSKSSKILQKTSKSSCHPCQVSVSSISSQLPLISCNKLFPHLDQHHLCCLHIHLQPVLFRLNIGKYAGNPAIAKVGQDISLPHESVTKPPWHSLEKPCLCVFGYFFYKLVFFNFPQMFNSFSNNTTK